MCVGAFCFGGESTAAKGENKCVLQMPALGAGFNRNATALPEGNSKQLQYLRYIRS